MAGPLVDERMLCRDSCRDDRKVSVDGRRPGTWWASKLEVSSTVHPTRYLSIVALRFHIPLSLPQRNMSCKIQ